MPAVFLSPIGGAGWQFFDNSGNPLSGGKLYTYAAGTTTPLATYTTSAGNVAHTNPIVLDAAGRVPGSSEIWITSQPYKFVLATSTDVVIKTYDNIIGQGIASYQVQNFTGDGVTTIFTLANSSLGENFTSVYINGVYQQKNTYTISGTTLTFSEAPPGTTLPGPPPVVVGASIEVMYN
jgi:hypothetical protein